MANLSRARFFTFFSRALWRMMPVAAGLLAVALALAACASKEAVRPAAEPGVDNAYLPDLPGLAPASEVWRNEPPFTEKEVARFVRDLHNIQAMNAEDTVNHLLRDRGWTRERLRYMDFKIALIVTAINAGELESLSVAGPYYLPPTREEIHAVQAHYPILNNLLKTENQAGN